MFLILSFTLIFYKVPNKILQKYFKLIYFTLFNKYPSYKTYMFYRRKSFIRDDIYFFKYWSIDYGKSVLRVFFSTLIVRFFIALKIIKN